MTILIFSTKSIFWRFSGRFWTIFWAIFYHKFLNDLICDSIFLIFEKNRFGDSIEITSDRFEYRPAIWRI